MSATTDTRRAAERAVARRAREAAARAAARDDQSVVEALLRRHARALGVEWKSAVAGRRPLELRARHSTWRDLAALRWSASRIARAFSTDHTSVIRVLRQPARCPVCGEKFESMTDAPLTMTAGVETQHAYRHSGRVCIRRAAFVLRGESEAA